MPAIFHVKIEDDTFDGAVNHIVEASDDDTVWHCEEAGDNFDGAIFHVKWAEDGHEEPVWRVSGISRGTVTTVGPAVSPLSLPDAVANSLSYVKAFGGTEQNGTPTPDAPVNIVCNNGILKVKDSELPVGYKRLKNIKTTGDVRYISNVYLTGSDTLRFTFQASPGNLLGSYNDSSANDNYSFYNTTGATGSYARYNGQTGGSSTYTGTTYSVTMSPTGITGIRNPSSFTPREFTCSVPFCIFATSLTGSEHSNATIIGSIEVSGSQNLKFIPCERVSDGAIGFWETSNQEFLENQENGTPTTDGYDTTYMTEVYVDGTVETVTTKQAFINDSDVVDRTGLNSSNGSAITNNSRCYVLFPCKAGVTYTAQTDTADLIGGNFIEYNQPVAASANFIKSLTVTNDGLVGGVYKSHVVCDADGWAGWQCKSNKATAMANNWQVTSDISSATCEPLLAVGDYADVQEILSGAVTRNVGVKILDGTERFTVRQTQSGIATMSLSNCPRYAGSSEIEFIVSHFIFQQLIDGGSKTSGKPIGFYAYYSDDQPSTRNWYFNVDATLYPTADDFKQFLAAQAAAGTPVIVVYPLATPTTEAVTGQTLQVTDGDNTLEITQASILDLEIEAKYMKGVVASVEEVDSQGLDNNVSVSLS